jgi:hypothetical protein
MRINTVIIGDLVITGCATATIAVSMAPNGGNPSSLATEAVLQGA